MVHVLERVQSEGSMSYLIPSEEGTRLVNGQVINGRKGCLQLGVEEQTSDHFGVQQSQMDSFVGRLDHGGAIRMALHRGFQLKGRVPVTQNTRGWVIHG